MMEIGSMGVRQQLLNLMKPIHRNLRRQKCELFFRQLNPKPSDSFLDVGGGTGFIGEFLQVYLYFSSVRVVNLFPQPFEGEKLKHVQWEVADGCALPFADKSFDWVFSNAVIEHVGGWERQRLFAGEIRRVARKGYFVATPNRHFPVDPHTLLPFYQYLSPEWQSRACRFAPGYTRKYEPIDLLSKHNLQELFPDAVVSRMGIRILSNNLVAYRSEGSVV
jgi:ubiquinone/menaquinone biosynthesis C-methylase UbiE